MVTFTSDLGSRDFSVAAIKGAIISACTNFPQIVDVSHAVRQHDIKDAAYIVSNAYKYFPKGSIHLVHVNAAFGQHKLLICEVDNNYFLTFDTGLLSLLFTEAGNKTYCVNEELMAPQSLLFEHSIAHVISLLQQEYLPKDFAYPYPEAVGYKLLQPVTNRGSVRGSIIYIDHFGNAVTNISKDVLKDIVSGPRFTIFANVGSTNQISNSYDDVEEGEMICLFNSAGLLEVGISKGRAVNLLGLKIDSPVIVMAD